jgi:hypothetical protein
MELDVNDFAGSNVRTQVEREIVVTQEMIEAGIDCYFRYDRRSDDIDEILPAVFRAMVTASRST